NVLKREDIRIVERSIFQTLDAYSAPRLVEYYDDNPCEVRYYPSRAYALEDDMEMNAETTTMFKEAKKYKVTIEAKYNVDEYEILILSAKESEGLKTWLLANGYQIPEKAEHVLEPYIKSNLKFFVVKVNLEKYNPQANGGYLRPLQITVNSDKFMLPIRLGMANSKGEQDMLVYAFSKKGRVECTNYRTVEMPTGNLIPTFVKNNFGNFYTDVFRNKHSREGRNAIMLEYAWNVTPSWGGMKCDPCVGNPPYFTDLTQAGVSWANSGNQSVYFTRLHVRYTLDKFPEDLFFQETPNQSNYQARYVINHPANGNLSCDEGKKYIVKLRQRRKKELAELAELAQWDTYEFYDYIANGTDKIIGVEEKSERNSIPFIDFGNSNKNGGPSKILLVLFLSLLGLFGIIQLRQQYNSKA
ncbi:MAG: hypothetical protein RLZZ337_707, partial [Bacteroidota bacterium]